MRVGKLQAVLLVVVAACAASIFVEQTRAKADDATLKCTSSSLAAVDIVIVEDGRSLVIRDYNAHTQDMLPIQTTASDMIGHVLDEYLKNNAYQCAVMRGSGRRWN